ncbi:MAG: response regulator transcription factor [Chloroflexi bacterium]|nr:response regulator transcription factor [Chloroflexota bacterium]
MMSNHAHILIVDDEPAFQTLLRLSLQRAGYTVQIASTGQAALDQYVTSDLVLLDVILPDMSGFAVCGELRKRSDIPIVMLTASNRNEDIVHAFNLGVDDYIVKPCRMDEMIARLRAVLRRSAWQTPQSPVYHIFAAPNLLLNDTLHEVWVRGELVALTPREYEVLRHLMRHPNQAVSKSELGQLIWDDPSSVETNHIEVTIRRLREKIEIDPSHPCLVLTVRGSGYLFSIPSLTVQTN